MNNIEDKLREYDFFDGSIIKHGNVNYVRDYEVIAYIPGQTDKLLLTKSDTYSRAALK